MKEYEDLILFGGIGALCMGLAAMGMKVEATALAQTLIGAIAMYLKGK